MPPVFSRLLAANLLRQYAGQRAILPLVLPVPPPGHWPLRLPLHLPVAARAFATFPTRRGKNTYHGFARESTAKPDSTGHRLYVALLGGVLVFCVLCGSKIPEWLRLDSASPEAVDTPEADEDNGSDGGKEDGKKKKRVGFRDRKIIEYENRLRIYSTPDKLFRYFATLDVKKDNGEYEVFMSPEDFVRSLLPDAKQPEGLGLDKFIKYDPKRDHLDVHERLPLDSVFYKLDDYGLISFNDYIFLLTLLSTPPKQFELAFKMFDANGDGTLDFEEYEKVQSVIRSKTSVGQKHRNHATTGNVLRLAESTSLSRYFFGENLDKKLTYARFQEFHTNIQDEVLRLEFTQFAEDDVMSVKTFASMLLVYAGFSQQKKSKLLRNVKKQFKGETAGITFDEYRQFHQVLKCINELDAALTFYHIVGAAIDKATLKHVAQSVAHVQLSDHLVDVVFAIFDENSDGRLSNSEFAWVMKKRLLRGLEHPRDTGVSKLLSAMYTCTKSQVVNLTHRIAGSPP